MEDGLTFFKERPPSLFTGKLRPFFQDIVSFEKPSKTTGCNSKSNVPRLSWSPCDLLIFFEIQSIFAE